MDSRPDFFTISAVSLAFFTAASKDRRAKSACFDSNSWGLPGVR